MKEDGLETIHNALFLGEIVDCMRPEAGDELYDRVGTVHNTRMRPVLC